jgi:hypothetical protein
VCVCVYNPPSPRFTVHFNSLCVMVHLASNHHLEQKLAAFHYYINRLITLPITEQSKQKEWETILTIARNNGYPVTMIQSLGSCLIVL